MKKILSMLLILGLCGSIAFAVETNMTTVGNETTRIENTVPPKTKSTKINKQNKMKKHKKHMNQQGASGNTGLTLETSKKK